MSKWDKILTATILCVCMLSIIFINVYAYAHKPETVIVELDGREYAKYKLSEINSPKSIEINSKYGYNKIEIFSDGVKVTESDCKDKIDVAIGKITRSNEQIVCLPHRLVIRIEGGGVHADAVAY